MLGFGDSSSCCSPELLKAKVRPFDVPSVGDGSDLTLQSDEFDDVLSIALLGEIRALRSRL